MNQNTTMSTAALTYETAWWGTLWTRKCPFVSLSPCYEGGYTGSSPWIVPVTRQLLSLPHMELAAFRRHYQPSAAHPNCLLMDLLLLSLPGRNTCWSWSTWQPVWAPECVWCGLCESNYSSRNPLVSVFSSQIQNSVGTRVWFTWPPKETITLPLAPGSVVLSRGCRKLILSCLCSPHSTQDNS